MVPARVHNAVLSRVRAWTSLAGRLHPELVRALRRDPAVVELLAGVRAEAVIRVDGLRAAADLLVLLDHVNLHSGRRLYVVPRGRWEYLVTDSAGSDAAARILAGRFTEAPGDTDFLPWPGRITRIALITCDRPDTLAATLDAYLENLRRFHRRYVEVVVYDDSGPAGQRRARGLVDARRAGGARVRYVGPPEKRRLRAGLERRLATALPHRRPPADVLDALLGTYTADGRWRGSSAEQRNWATLFTPRARVLVSDDDARPELLDVALDGLRAAAVPAAAALESTSPPVWPCELLQDALAGLPARPALTAWSTDLIGRFDESEPGLVSAAYTGHPDRRTALWLERFFELSDESVDVLDVGAPLRPVRREAPAARSRKFRGGVYVTSGRPDGVAFAVRRGRNEDFSLALSQRLTSRGRVRPRELDTVHMLHQRGARHVDPFAAHCQERAGDLVNHLLATAAGPAADLAVRLGRELFAEGLAYRRRALAHLRALAATPAGRWYADRAVIRVKRLRSAARRLRAGRALSGGVLAECLHVLLPERVLTAMDRRVARRELRCLPAPDRSWVAALLEREARFLRGPSGLRPVAAAPADLDARIARKRELTRRLVAEIEAHLGLPPTDDAWEAAEQQFAAQVQAHVCADVRRFVEATPWVYALRQVGETYSHMY